MNETERQIVAWLKRYSWQRDQLAFECNYAAERMRSDHAMVLAHAIERGEHRETGDHD